MIRNSLLTGLVMWLTSLPCLSQVCLPGTIQLQNDVLPADPSGSTQITVIAGICPGDKAASVFDVSAYTAPVKVHRAGILFAGPAGSQPATGRLQIFDGVSFAPNGSATLGPNVYTGTVVSYPLNTLQSIDVSQLGITVSSGTLVVSFSIVSNPNGGCAGGYAASFATDNTQPSGGCNSPPETNLIFDSGTGWWDIPDFQIQGFNWCGLAYNGNWVIRACVEPADPWTDLGGGTVGVTGQPDLGMSGPLTPSSLVTLDLVNAAPLELALVFVSFTSSPLAFLGGSLHAFPFDELVIIGTDAAGEIHGSAFFPGSASGQGLWFQVGIQDLSVPIHGAALSNAVLGTVP